MQPSLLILPIIVPVLFWSAYHYHKDRHLPEPPQNLAACFGLGIIAAAISQGLYIGLEPLGLRYDAYELAARNPWQLLLYAVLAIGPIEEFAKLLPFVVIVMRFKAYDEPIDGIIYASFIGLGFAAAENLQYLDYLTRLEAIARGFAGPVVHIVFASIWAHWITRAKLRGSSTLVAGLQGFLCAAFLHGIYDFLVLLRPVSALPVAAALILALWVWRLRLMRRMHREAVQAERSDQPRL